MQEQDPRSFLFKCIANNTIKKWNDWKKEYTDPIVLSGADLTDADLREADLKDANLSKADLKGANLRGADLQAAHLIGANLSHADLKRAYLQTANLPGANLSNANLTNANFLYADLTNANLTGANLINANLTNANLTNANLTDAKLQGANLWRADFQNAILDGAQYGNNINKAINVTKRKEHFLISEKIQHETEKTNQKLLEAQLKELKKEQREYTTRNEKNEEENTRLKDTIKNISDALEETQEKAKKLEETFNKKEAERKEISQIINTMLENFDTSNKDIRKEIKLQTCLWWVYIIVSILFLLAGLSYSGYSIIIKNNNQTPENLFTFLWYILIPLSSFSFFATFLTQANRRRNNIQYLQKQINKWEILKGLFLSYNTIEEDSKVTAKFFKTSIQQMVDTLNLNDTITIPENSKDTQVNSLLSEILDAIKKLSTNSIK